MELTGHRSTDGILWCVNTAKIGHLIIGCFLFRGCPFTESDSGVQAIFAGEELDLLMVTGYRKAVAMLTTNDCATLSVALLDYHLMFKVKMEMDQKACKHLEPWIWLSPTHHCGNLILVSQSVSNAISPGTVTCQHICELAKALSLSEILVPGLGPLVCWMYISMLSFITVYEVTVPDQLYIGSGNQAAFWRSGIQLFWRFSW